ncbi:homoserine kinase [Balneatrix alpica]|uniref:homoserine kinase n=1 Tax=Balneatrix alpica TaxID=75684 RepID=UPI0027394578|nr:homoserine kinase [Balneatrix alpica]
MAVFTPVSFEQLEGFLAGFDLGKAVALKGIEGGVENTNYFVTTENQQGQQHFVLTLFEDLSYEEMPFFVELTTWLAERGVPVPAPLQDRNGIALHQLNRRPALLLPRFAGQHLSKAELSPTHCATIGSMLARFHLGAADFFMQRQAHRGLFWWRRESGIRAQQLPPDEAQLLLATVAEFDQIQQRQQRGELELPLGVVHGDLFHDNALFAEGQLTAIIDIYNASSSYWLYDLAITANDWCIQSNGQWDQARLQALLQAYAALRPFTAGEREAWPVVVRTAAMRFWLSRLEQINPDGSYMKDPTHFRDVLRARLADPGLLP